VNRFKTLLLTVFYGGSVRFCLDMLCRVMISCSFLLYTYTVPLPDKKKMHESEQNTDFLYIKKLSGLYMTKFPL
jgi:hypothetical protein